MKNLSGANWLVMTVYARVVRPCPLTSRWYRLALAGEARRFVACQFSHLVSLHHFLVDFLTSRASEARFRRAGLGVPAFGVLA